MYTIASFFLNLALVAPCHRSFVSVLSFSVYGKGGKLDTAVEMFDTAQDLGLPIDEKIYTNMLSLYGKAGAVKKSIKTFFLICFAHYLCFLLSSPKPMNFHIFR